ncbi:hypothetical protein [Halostella pelagica]|uniref:hypothetical protein n=1 Tax=Halostella pelagica TaxID=2583824 RepID=UPI00108205CB|nr:hypothetical protein [Halostella pelagica]
MHWSKPSAGLAVLLVGLLAVSTLGFVLADVETAALATAALIAATVAVFVALGWTERRSTPYW